MIEEMYEKMKEGKNQTSRNKIAMTCCISAERFHYTKLQYFQLKRKPGDTWDQISAKY